jgi:dihydroxyacetone kinase-like protein
MGEVILVKVNTALVVDLIEECRKVIAGEADRLCALDQAIGDGDHGTNMARGLEALGRASAEFTELDLAQTCERIGVILVSNIGGAPGPLYGTLFIELGKHLATSQGKGGFAEIFARATEAVARRGRAKAGDKTLLDVLYAVEAALRDNVGFARIAAEAREAAFRTGPMLALRGRAAWLGPRSVGHIDPGAESCALIAGAICNHLQRDAEKGQRFSQGKAGTAFTGKATLAFPEDIPRLFSGLDHDDFGSIGPKAIVI